MAVKRYDGSQWVTVAGKGDQGTSSSISTWVKTASGGETSLSGNDDNSQALSYTVGQELVFINGTLLKRGSDYTATDGTTITGLAALAANDVATVWTVTAFSVTNAISNTLVDAKGDLVTASGADVPARLAVGNNGETLVADSSASAGLRWQGQFMAGKNAIINGDFRINQRAFSSSTTSGSNVYGFDRWFMYYSNGTCTYSAQTFTPGAAPVAGYEAVNFARIQTTGQTLVSAETELIQRIEDVRTFAGQTVTLSFWAKAASGTPKIAINYGQEFGSGGSANVQTYGGQVTISTTWTRYSLTFAVPSISGKTIGTGSTFCQLLFWLSAGSNFDARTGSIGIQTNTFDIWGVQLEAGSVATPFTTATGTLAGELAACQRYYEKGRKDIWSGNTTNAVQYYNNLRFAVTKRTTSPTITVVSTALSGFPSISTAEIGAESFRFTATANATQDGSYYSIEEWNASAEL